MQETFLESVLKEKTRLIVRRTRGIAHGPITRLVSPSDIGHDIKPFVFLDYIDIDPERMQPIGFHPHSGIETVTVLLEGEVAYQETSGTQGIIASGGVEWIHAAGGVWHTGGPAGSSRIKGYQFWLALPPEQENGKPEARYIEAARFRRSGPARVILGKHGDVTSELYPGGGINFLEVSLKRGEKWRYEPPPQHTVAWVAVHEGALAAPEIRAGELVVFEQSNAAIEFEAREDTGFVLGSAVKHPHDLVLGAYSVHTSRAALKKGEERIVEISHEYPFVRTR